MKTINVINLLAATTLAFAGATKANADGFVCRTPQKDLAIQVYNHVHPEDGTRNAAILIAADTTINPGHRTIAIFRDTDTTLSNQGAQYIAEVKLDVADTSRRGELIGGTKLGYLKYIILKVDFSYAHPMNDGDLTKGQLTLLKRNRDTLDLYMECERYLKNSDKLVELL